VDEAEQQLVEMALSNIQQGVLSGSYQDPQTGKRLEWSASSPTGDHVIKIWGPDEPKP
jgi:hypothetical protein